MKCVCVAHEDGDASVSLFGECAAPSDTEFVAVDGGESFSIGIDVHGAVIGWGSAFYGELGSFEAAPAANDADAESEGSTEQRRSSRTLVLPARIAVPEKCVGVTCGTNHALVVSQSGAVFAWGWNRYGQVARDEAREVVAVPSLVAFPEGAGQIKTVAAGGMHSLALAADGRVWSWGHNASGQLGIGSEQEVHASPTQVSLPQGTAAAAIAAGWAHSALLTADGGELYTFGWGLYHQLGHGSTRDQSKPCVVDALRGLDPSCGGSLVQVACGSWHTAVRTQNGDIYTWGWGKDGQLGHDEGTAQALPRVANPSSGYFDSEDSGHAAIDVVCGVRHTLVLCANGDLHWWGKRTAAPADGSSTRDAWGKLTSMQTCRKVAAGHSHALLLVQNSTIPTTTTPAHEYDQYANRGGYNNINAHVYN